jgi:hypothetical protein
VCGRQFGAETTEGVGRARVAEGGREVRVPEPRPQPADGAAARREVERVVDPRVRILDPAILAEGAVHPDERNEVERRNVARDAGSSGDDVRHAESEAVPVGEPERRVVREAGTRHRELGRPGAHSQEVLPDPEHGGADERRQALALGGERCGAAGGREAAVEPDLVSPAGHGREDAASAPRLGTIGEIAGADGAHRRRAGEDEPGACERRDRARRRARRPRHAEPDRRPRRRPAAPTDRAARAT